MTFYRIVSFGQTIPGASASSYIQVSAVAKADSNNAPRCVANEYISAELGRFIGLTIPPAGLMRSDAKGKTWFASLDFNFSGVQLPPIIVNECLATLPKESTGVILLDVLLANPDRHTGNLAIDLSADPPLLLVFDHSHALFNLHPDSRRLKSEKDQLGIGGHCLAKKIDTAEHFPSWIQKIESTPDHYIEQVCYAPVKAGVLTGTDAQEVIAFIKHRRSSIRTILGNNKDKFPEVKQWSLFAQ